MTAVMCAMAMDDIAHEYELHTMGEEISNDFIAIRSSVIERALFHDIEEAITGDIPRVDEIYEETKPVKKEAVACIDSILFDGAESLMFSRVREDAKGGSSGNVVAFFDTFSLISECLKDKHMGNTMLDGVVERAENILKELVVKANHTYVTGRSSRISHSITEYLNDLYFRLEIHLSTKYGLYPEKTLSQYCKVD